MLDRMPEWALGKKLGKLHIMDLLSALRGGINKNKLFFFSEKLRKGGGGISPNPKFPYQKKMRFFWIFSSKGGGGLT